MKTKIVAKSALMMAVLALAVSCGSKDKKATTEQTKKTVVKVSIASQEIIDEMAQFTGTIEPFLENKISPAMAVRIDKIRVEVGDRVAKGQLLVEMDKSQYLQTAAQLANLETDLARLEALYAQGGVSKQQVDQLTTQVEVAKTALANLKDNTELRSPIDGVVTERLFDPGDMFSPSVGRIVTVMQLSRVKVSVNVSESYFTKVKMGMPVKITLDLYPDKVFEGKVSLIYPAIDAATHTFTTEITIPNGDAKLRPGMFSRVALNFGKADRVVIPDIAVQKQMGSNERFVFVVEDSIAHRRVVQTGQVIGDSFEILSGVTKGEQVVIAGAQKLLDNSVVTISK